MAPMHEGGRGWLDALEAHKRAAGLIGYAVLALGIMIAGNVVGVAMIIYRLPANVLDLAPADPALQLIFLRAACWAVIAVIAAVCAVFVWRHKSRIAILVGIALEAFDWADWAFGLLGREPFTLLGLISQVATSLMLAVGLLGAVGYHRSSKVMRFFEAQR